MKPKHNPALSAYIMELTGIQQAALDAQGVSFGEALTDFFAFCDGGRIPVFCYGYDDVLVIDENCRLNDLPPAVFPPGLRIRRFSAGGSIPALHQRDGLTAVGADSTWRAQCAQRRAQPGGDPPPVDPPGADGGRLGVSQRFRPILTAPVCFALQ